MIDDLGGTFMHLILAVTLASFICGFIQAFSNDTDDEE